ncbi:hypothetical protein [Roseibium sp. RKSG952]|uniref:hypothetical protein n=1 Tax=Roseibium sp. RKSG952 TaxID=2529384 RepID=UPI0018AD1C3D|nr:hypothetical protein [Roseibium sp. RKSG952]
MLGTFFQNPLALVNTAVDGLALFQDIPFCLFPQIRLLFLAKISARLALNLDPRFVYANDLLQSSRTGGFQLNDLFIFVALQRTLVCFKTILQLFQFRLNLVSAGFLLNFLFVNLLFPCKRLVLQDVTFEKFTGHDLCSSFHACRPFPLT